MRGKISYNALTGMITTLKRASARNFSKLPEPMKKEIYNSCMDMVGNIQDIEDEVK